MNKIITASIALSSVLLLSACGIVQNANQNTTPEQTSTGTTMNTNVNSSMSSNLNMNLNANSNASAPARVQTEYLKNLSLVANQPIETPLVITGEAKGWYFEGSFPIEIQDATGKVLTTVPAQAKGDWMSEDFVPFSATISFPKPTTKTGKVILRRDNPSGLPEYDMSYGIAVQFVGVE